MFDRLRNDFGVCDIKICYFQVCGFNVGRCTIYTVGISYMQRVKYLHDIYEAIDRDESGRRFCIRGKILMTLLKKYAS